MNRRLHGTTCPPLADTAYVDRGGFDGGTGAPKNKYRTAQPCSRAVAVSAHMYGGMESKKRSALPHDKPPEGN